MTKRMTRRKTKTTTKRRQRNRKKRARLYPTRTPRLSSGVEGW